MKAFTQFITIFAFVGFAACAPNQDANSGAGQAGFSDRAGLNDYAAAIEDLQYVLPRAFAAMEWATIRLTDDLTSLTASAMTPDGREVRIRASITPERRTAVQVQVGIFGDLKLQEAFLAELGRQLDRLRRAPG